MSTDTQTKDPSALRIGLFVDRTAVSKYVYDFAAWADEHERLQITHLILSSEAPRPLDELLGYVSPRGTIAAGRHSIISRLLFKALVAVERMLLLKNKRHYDHLRKFDLLSLVPNALRLELAHSADAHPPVSDKDVASIRALNFDILINVSRRHLDGDIANAARLGVISLDLADSRQHQGGPQGFWEVYFRQDTTGFTIVRSDESTEGDVILRGHVGTQFYYLLSQAALCEKAHYYFKSLVEGVANTGRVPDALPSIPFCDRPRGQPKVHQVIFYLTRLFWAIATRAFRKLFQINCRWNVAFLHTNWRDAAFWRANIIANPPRRYLADPFVVSRNGRTFCYMEDYDEATRRGRISVYEIGTEGADFIGVALEEPFHLSFPYLFEYRDGLYMCPESSENLDIRIYKCVEFPLRWKLETVIMKNVSAVDTMLFEKDGTWWMFTNIDPAGYDDHCLELCVFSADRPLDDRWAAHPQNPIYIDASRARNAGLIKEGDRLFRISQGQGFDFYGKRTSVNEVIALDEKSYVERRVCTIEPTFLNGISGTHHLHSNGNVTVFDFARTGMKRS